MIFLWYGCYFILLLFFLGFVRMCVKGILILDEIVIKWKKFLLKMYYFFNLMNKKNYLCCFVFLSFVILFDYCGKLIYYKIFYLYDWVYFLLEFFVFGVLLI